MFYSFRSKITKSLYYSKGHENLDESQVMLGRSLDTAGSCGAYHVVLQMGLLLWPQFGGAGLGCDFLGELQLGVIYYFRTNWGAKEPQNLPNRGVVAIFLKRKNPQEKLYTPNSLTTGSPENDGFQKESLFPMADFQVNHVKLQRCRSWRNNARIPLWSSLASCLMVNLYQNLSGDRFGGEDHFAVPPRSR